MRRLVLGLLCLFLVAAEARAREGVDLELVLAVDVSFSMDPEEQRLQREGYVEAFRDPEVLQAIANGIHGRIGVTYIEWAGAGRSRVLVPWITISDRASAEVFIEKLSREPYSRLSRTSISTGLIAAMDAFKASPFEPLRRVIDVSGDGPNNDGPRVVPVRDAIVEQGVVINGLPILLNRAQTRGQANWGDIPNLDIYYEDCVIGGPGSFSIPIREQHEFVPATRRKILMEIANLTPEPTARVMHASTGPRVSCEIGEQMFRRWTDR